MQYRGNIYRALRFIRQHGNTAFLGADGAIVIVSWATQTGVREPFLITDRAWTFQAIRNILGY